MYNDVNLQQFINLLDLFRNYRDALYQISDDEVEKWFLVITLFRWVPIILCLLCTVLLLVLGGWFNSFTASLYWFTSFVLVSVCFLGNWWTLSKCLFCRNCFDENLRLKTVEEGVVEEPVKNFFKEQKLSEVNKTVFFTLEENIDSSLHQLNLTPSIGPKLQNVKWNSIKLSKKIGTSEKKKREGSKRLSLAMKRASGKPKSTLKKKLSKRTSKLKRASL